MALTELGVFSSVEEARAKLNAKIAPVCDMLRADQRVEAFVGTLPTRLDCNNIL